MSAPVLGPSERAAWEALRRRIMLDSTAPDPGAERRADEVLVDAITALLAAEPEAHEDDTRTGGVKPLSICPHCGPVCTGHYIGCASHKPPAAAAPDAELEWLFRRYRSAVELLEEVRRNRDYPAMAPRTEDILDAEQQITAYFQRREAAARGEVVGTGYLRHMREGRRIELRGAVLTDSQWFTDADGIPIALTRRAE